MAFANQFPTTQWSMILDYESGVHKAPANIEKFCRVYWSPVVSFVRSMGVAKEDAEDLTQEIFSTFHSGNKISEMNPTKGRMRSYLKATAKRKALNFFRDQSRLKRGGAVTHVTLEEENLVGDLSGPEHEFDRKWALKLIDLTANELKVEYEKRGREAWFEALFPQLTGRVESLASSQVASNLESTESAVRTALHRMRQKYQKILRAHVAKTVASEDEIDTELMHLFNALSGA